MSARSKSIVPATSSAITIRTSRPGIVIGRKGAEIEKLKQDLARKTKREVFIDIQEVHKPELDAQLVSESIALQLEKRVAFRRAMRKAVDSALRFGCKGIKVRVSGRLNGAEIARSEWYLQGQLPLHTLRADIDYGFSEAHTTYGIIGIKCWIYKGEVLGDVRRAGALGRDPEPRRRDRPERRDRGGRPGDRGGADRGGADRGPRGPRAGGGYDRPPAADRGPFDRTRAAEAQSAPAQGTGETGQNAPEGQPSRSSAPIMPPLASPQQQVSRRTRSADRKPARGRGRETNGIV